MDEKIDPKGRSFWKREKERHIEKKKKKDKERAGVKELLEKGRTRKKELERERGKERE